MTRVIVCGGRDYGDRARVWAVLDGLLTEVGSFVLAHNHIDNADALAREWADKRKVSAEDFHGDAKLDRLSTFASRNIQMFDAGADLVVAFPGERNRADMVRQARARGVPVREVQP